MVDASGFDVVAAQIIGMGPAQSFSRTVTIDAGVDDGVVPDLTVVNADGLVGRVIGATRDAATVLLIADPKSTVGGRLGDSMELGFLDGAGDITDSGALEFSLVDHTVSPRVGDTVVSWGSRNGAPYVAGVPIGAVVAVHSSPAELTQTAIVQPFVDFSSLDVVAVVTGVEKAGSGDGSGSTKGAAQ
jgi:rod shape-determining protein MreC